MVRRLVEEEEVGFGDQRAGQRGPGELATREGLQAAVELLVAEAEAVDGAQRALAPGVAAVVLELALGAAVGVERALADVAVGHLGLEARELLLERDEVGGAGGDVVAQRQAGVARGALVVQGDAGALGVDELAAVDAR